MTEIVNLTPPHLRCHVGESCQSLHKLPDGRLLVVGKRIDENTPLGDIGDDEDAIIIDPSLLDTFVAEKVALLQEETRLLRDGFHKQGDEITEGVFLLFADSLEGKWKGWTHAEIAADLRSQVRALSPSSPGGEG